jgi:aminoglycoside phosphotransferase (APT) family kinase protein
VNEPHAVEASDGTAPASAPRWSSTMVAMSNGPGAPLTDGAKSVMRARPPEPTLRWLLSALGATEVVDIRPMPGGSTAAMHRVTLRRMTDATQTVVLRRYILDDIVAETPDIVARETTALRLAATTDIPTPELLAEDPDARETDAPTVVMSWLDGRPQWQPGNRRQFVNEIADAMIAVASIEVPPETAIAPISRYRQSSYDQPRWATRPNVWERAVEAFHGPIPTGDVGFVHRDFHPGNLLWTRRHLNGIVDWQAACIGPHSIDPGHCRLNFLYYDDGLAGQLRSAWEDRSGRPYDPWADVMSIIGSLDNMRSPKNASKSRLAIEDTLAQAVADLAG